MTGSPVRWLLGAWRSDKERTLKEWLYASGKRAAMQRILKRDLGKLVQRYAPKHAFTYSWFEQRWFRSRYRVIWHNRDSLFLVHGPKHNEGGVMLHFVSPDLYWVHAGKNIEYFARIAPHEIPRRGPATVTPNPSLQRTRRKRRAAELKR